MLITEVTPAYILQWLSLAAEMESLYQGAMVNDPGFDTYMQAKIAKREAFMAMDRMTQAVMGIIGFSCTHNRISWFGVFERYRKQGVGSKLLRCALNQLDLVQPVTVCTFRADNPAGQPARCLYQKFGFVETDTTTTDESGHPRCVMTLFPDTTVRRGTSFHYHYQRYMKWAQPEHCPVCCKQPGPPEVVLIKELDHVWVEALMEAQGTLWGKCHVLCKKHCLDLHELSADDLLNFMSDVQKASKALKTVSGAVKINYEIHGNSMPHLHVHLFPRYLDDPFPSAPIDYRLIEPNPYQNEAGFQYFINAMRRELEQM